MSHAGPTERARECELPFRGRVKTATPGAQSWVESRTP